VIETYNEPRHIDYRNGIKALDEENFLWADRVGLYFTPFGLGGAPVVATREEIDQRVKSFTDIRVSDAVPTELQILFEFAKGAMVYGLFFYPLYTLGWEQLSRVFEAAVTTKVSLLEPSLSESPLAKKVQWLKERGHLPASEVDKYDLFRQWRNRVAHPKAHTLVGPPDARRMLREMRDLLDYLFDPGSRAGRE